MKNEKDEQRIEEVLNAIEKEMDERTIEISKKISAFINEAKNYYSQKNIKGLLDLQNKVNEIELEINQLPNRWKKSNDQSFNPIKNSYYYLIAVMFALHKTEYPKHFNNRYAAAIFYLKVASNESADNIRPENLNGFISKLLVPNDITPNDQLFLFYLHDCVISKFTSTSGDKDEKLAGNLIFAFKNKTCTEYLLRDPEIKALFIQQKDVLNQLPLDKELPKNAYESYLCFILGYLYETGDREFDITANIGIAQKCYEKACSHAAFDQQHPEARSALNKLAYISPEQVSQITFGGVIQPPQPGTANRADDPKSGANVYNRFILQ